jgi:hypothetical protein
MSDLLNHVYHRFMCVKFVGRGNGRTHVAVWCRFDVPAIAIEETYTIPKRGWTKHRRNKLRIFCFLQALKTHTWSDTFPEDTLDAFWTLQFT